MMRKLSGLLAILLFSGSATLAAEFRFADQQTGANILSADDIYLSHLGPAEISIRLGDATSTALDDLKNTYREGVQVWTDDDRTKFAAMLARNKVALEKLAPLLPDTVLLIKVDNSVEGGLPHTRANAIVYPARSLSAPDAQFDSLFFHELFHVLSRHQQARHDSLFNLIGFEPCVFNEPESMRERHLSNPDAPTNRHYIPVTVDGDTSAVIPYLYTSRDRFDPEIQGGFPGHFGFGLLEVTVADGICSAVFKDDGDPNIISPDQADGFFEAIGRNTSYIIHPEETLADNFSYLMLGREDLPNPEIPARLADWLGIND